MARDPATRLREREIRRARTRRRRQAAVGLPVLVIAAVGVAIGMAGAGQGHGGANRPSGTGSGANSSAATSTASPPPPPPAPSSFAVGIQSMQFVDTSREVKFLDGSVEPRTLVTEVRYPALGSTSHIDEAGANPDTTHGPYPLIVFGHGFEQKPSVYRQLLQSWARAGYVVAAPAFPLESPDAPGGALESDLVNQPEDMHFVIDQLLAESEGSGPLAGLINPGEIAVAGQSDGGDTALAVAYDPRFRDRRIRAAVILSGAEIPTLGPFTFPGGGPPLLAIQGTADKINPPASTYEYFAAAHRPKYLVRLPGAEHLPPYTSQQPQLGIVERTTLDFFNAYLKHAPEALQALHSDASVSGKAALQAEP